MNKNLKLSIAAAMVVSSLFVGCSSNKGTTSSGSSVSGAPTKAELIGATISTVGGTTIGTSDSNGRFTGTLPAGTTVVQATGGYYTLNDVNFTNSATLKAKVVDGFIKINMLTTLIQRFQDANGTMTEAQAKAAAFTALGITADANTTDTDSVDEGSYETKAIAIAMALQSTESNSTTSSNTFLNSLAAGNTVTAAYTATGQSDLNTTVLSAAESATNPYIVAKMIQDNNSTSAPALPALARSIDIDGNTSNMGGYYLNASFTDLALQGDAIDATGYIDNNQTILETLITDNNSSYSRANSGTLIVTIDNIDAANKNASYALAISSLDINTTSGQEGLFFVTNSSTKVELHARSDNGTYVGLDDVNVTEFYNLGALSADTADNSQVQFNIAMFINYMKMIFANEAVSDGNFTSGFDGGNYSAKLFINVDNKKVTTEDAKYQLTSTTVSVGKDDEGNNNGTAYIGYKVLDANLTY